MEPKDDDAYRRARKRVKEVRDFYGHLIVYLVVNAIFVVVDVADGNSGDTSFLGLNWAFFPLIGWGAFVAGHGLSVFFGKRMGARWEERKMREYLEQERQREQQQQR